MNNLTTLVKSELHRIGVDIYGFGDLRELPSEVRHGLPTGIIIALKYPKNIIAGITELPTPEYRDFYIKLNEQLDNIATHTAEFLQAQGYKAIAQTRKNVGYGEIEFFTNLPHKTVATRAGIGWIGKSALLVTEKYGSMIRLSSILTDAPLDTATPINTSKCADCTICKDACPAGAVSGKLWNVNIHRDEFYDPEKCRDVARERSMRGFGGKDTLCGKCIEVCPWTRNYLRQVLR
ncbi:MAG: 4Fe-4S dicluster domain-containing protein [Defluviitaleaceae bacterium]|nr:4Fe-4S dicluster domain-containing protein [Defluviitaleaceae bacterium]